MTAATPPPLRKRVRVRVTGRVQGVGFRYATVDEALRLGLTGWVRNTRDGAVELVAEGPAAAVDRLVTWCHAGPPGALVTAVEAADEPHRGEFTTFEIRR